MAVDPSATPPCSVGAVRTTRPSTAATVRRLVDYENKSHCRDDQRRLSLTPWGIHVSLCLHSATCSTYLATRYNTSLHTL